MDTPNFFAIIPATVRYDKTLKANAKLLYGEITALTNKEGFCWATNEYFAKLYDVDGKTVSRWISQLNNKGYVNVQITFNNGMKERKIYINDINKINNTTHQVPTPEKEEPKEETKQEESKETLNVELIKDKFNQICTDLPKCTKITDKRKKRLEKIYKEEAKKDINFFEELFKKVHESDFLCGRATGFKSFFDWIINPSNMLKILEGNYKNKSHNANLNVEQHNFKQRDYKVDDFEQFYSNKKTS